MRNGKHNGPRVSGLLPAALCIWLCASLSAAAPRNKTFPAVEDAPPAVADTGDEDAETPAVSAAPTPATAGKKHPPNAESPTQKLRALLKGQPDHYFHRILPFLLEDIRNDALCSRLELLEDIRGYIKQHKVATTKEIAAFWADTEEASKDCAL